MIFLSAVNPLKVIATLLLVAVWLPASSHSFLEHCGFIHQAEHHDSGGSHDNDADHHDAADGKCSLTATHVRAATPKEGDAFVLFCELVFRELSELSIERPSSGLAPPGVAPPQFVHCWQFSFRAALPARAPSVIS